MIGAGIPWQLAERNPLYYPLTLAALGHPIWYNWQASQSHMDDSHYTPMVWGCALGPEFTRHIERAQRWRSKWRMYFLGNEPESKWQSDTSPAEFADAARTWLALVGGSWAGPGILWGDEGRYWLYEYIKIGGPIPTTWAIHIYGSDTPAGWDNQYNHVLRFLSGLGVHSRVVITETNAHGDYAECAALLHHLATRPDVTAYWYSAHDPFGPMRDADLSNADGTQRTPLGDLFAGLQSGPSGAGRNEHNVYMPVVRG